MDGRDGTVGVWAPRPTDPRTGQGELTNRVYRIKSPRVGFESTSHLSVPSSSSRGSTPRFRRRDRPGLRDLSRFRNLLHTHASCQRTSSTVISTRFSSKFIHHDRSRSRIPLPHHHPGADQWSPTLRQPHRCSVSGRTSTTTRPSCPVGTDGPIPPLNYNSHPPSVTHKIK